MVVEEPGHDGAAAARTASAARVVAGRSACSMAVSTSSARTVPSSAPSSSTMTPRRGRRRQRGVEGGPQRPAARGPRCRRGGASRGSIGPRDPVRLDPAERLAVARRRRAPSRRVGGRACVGASRRGRRSAPAVNGSSRRRLEAERPVAAVAADEVGHEVVDRVRQQVCRVGQLGEPPPTRRTADLVAELDRLVDVVGDEDDRLAELALQAQELVLQLLADDRVDGAERLVHEHHRRVGREGPGDADALLLAAGELGRVALGERGVETDPLEQLHRAGSRAFFLSQPSSRGTVATLSRMVRCGNSPACWMT